MLSEVKLITLLWLCGLSQPFLLSNINNATNILDRLFLLEQEVSNLRGNSRTIENVQSTLNTQIHGLFNTLSSMEASLKEAIAQLNTSETG
jgi:hypothetical protein